MNDQSVDEGGNLIWAFRYTIFGLIVLGAIGVVVCAVVFQIS